VGSGVGVGVVTGAAGVGSGAGVVTGGVVTGAVGVGVVTGGVVTGAVGVGVVTGEVVAPPPPSTGVGVGVGVVTGVVVTGAVVTGVVVTGAVVTGTVGSGVGVGAGVGVVTGATGNPPVDPLDDGVEVAVVVVVPVDVADVDVDEVEAPADDEVLPPLVVAEVVFDKLPDADEERSSEPGRPIRPDPHPVSEVATVRTRSLGRIPGNALLLRSSGKSCCLFAKTDFGNPLTRRRAWSRTQGRSPVPNAITDCCTSLHHASAISCTQKFYCSPM
jgi:hypothetical protein